MYMFEHALTRSNELIHRDLIFASLGIKSSRYGRSSHPLIMKRS
jgi:hypothetical protein